MMSVYKLVNISKTIDNRKILDNINLSLKPGCTFIIGPSGSGKSTLLNIMGFLDKSDDGKIYVDDDMILDDNESDVDKFRADKLGFIFQDGNLISGLTVRENLEYILDANGINEEYDEILKKFNVFGLLDNKAETLSGGERQRTAIIRALLKQSDIILADEPTGNLDEENSRIVFEELKKCADEYNKTVIIVSHDVEKAREFGDRIISLRDGRIIEDIVLKENNIEQSCSEKSTLLKEKSVKLKNIFMLIKKNYYSHKMKFFAVCSLISVSFAVLALCFNLYSGGEIVVNDMNINYMETDLVEIVKRSDKYSRILNDNTFTDNELEYIEQTGLFCEMVGYCAVDLKIVHQDTICDDFRLRFINNDDFFKNRVMSNNIEGTFISDSNEIIIGKDVKDFLFGEDDCLNKEVILTNATGYKHKVKICGINNTKNPDGVYCSYAAKDISMAFYEYIQNNSAAIYEKKIIDNEISSMSPGVKGKYLEYNNQKIIYGQKPVSENELLVDMELALKIIQKVYPDEYITAENINSNLDILNELFENEFYLVASSLFEASICGIVQSDPENSYSMYVSYELLNEMTRVRPYTLHAYIKDMNTVDDFKKHVLNADYNCLLKYEHLIASIGKKTETLRVLLLIIAIVMTFLSVIILYSFISMSIIGDKYQIGLLRALGGSNDTVKITYRVEYLIISIISTSFSVMLFFIFNLLVNKLLNIENIKIEINYLIPLIILVLCVLITQITCTLSLKKIKRYSISNCLRDR